MLGTVLMGKEGRVAQVENPTYTSECGSCHFAYQPQFLGKESWGKMLGELEQHFGTDASLDSATLLTLKDYLVNNAGRGTGTTQRISELYWFQREHREIPKRFVTQKEVGSISNCQKCHIRAEQGDYGERSIQIPNYGRWDD